VSISRNLLAGGKIYASRTVECTVVLNADADHVWEKWKELYKTHREAQVYQRIVAAKHSFLDLCQFIKDTPVGFRLHVFTQNKGVTTECSSISRISRIFSETQI
jgi:hypothetical protein